MIRAQRIQRRRPRIAATAVALVLALLAIVAPLTPIAPAPAAEAVKASGGAGQYVQSIEWIDWGTEGAAVTNGSRTITSTVAGQTLSITCTIAGLSGAMQAYRSGAWTGDAFDELYNRGGANGSNTMVAGLRPSADGGLSTFNLGCTATYAGAPLTLSGLVFADAEQSGNLERVGALAPTGTTWRLIDRYRSSGCTQSSYGFRPSATPLRLDLYGPTSATCSSGPAAVAFAQGASSLSNVTIQGGGLSAIALGVMVTLDFGDAPASYGEAGALLQAQYTGGDIATTSGTFGTNNRGVDLFATSLATPSTGTTSTAGTIGATIDGESAYTASTGTADDTTGIDDEDASFTFTSPTTGTSTTSGTLQVGALPGTSYSTTVSCTGSGQIAGWIDWARDGAFTQSGDESAQTVCASGSATLTWSVPATAVASPAATPTYLRVRAGLAGTALSPTGVVGAGEVEDHAVTVTIVPGSALVCAASSFYSVSQTGLVRRVTNANGTGSISDFGTFPGTLANVNALGIGAGGQSMYALERTAGSQDVVSILRYTPTTGWAALPGTGYTTGGTGSLITGAVSLTSGIYYYGGTHLAVSGGTYSFRIYKYDPATGANAFVGSIDTNLAASSNGDMIFDAAGNLILVLSSANGTSTYTVSAAHLAAATGGALPFAAAAVGTSIGSDVNGIAYESDGTIYAGTLTTVRRYDMSTWTQVGSSPVTSSLVASTDLASCIAPVSITVRKVVTGRVAATDQFTLSVRNASSTLLGAATTSGTATGTQAAVVTGINVPSSTSLTIGEAMASGSAANYQASWSCTSDGAAYAAGSGTTLALTTPSTPGTSVVCTFTNQPLVTTISISKVMQDVNGQNGAARQDWTVGMTATGGAATSPASTPTQLTAANGAASWTVRHSSATTNVSLAISEAQQAGFQFVSGSCTVTPLGGTATTVTLTSESGTVAGVTAGSTVACTFTNKVKATTLTLVKQVTSGSAAPSLFTLTATAPSGSLAGPSGATGTAAATARITPGSAYRLSESGGPATYAQVGSWTCVNQAGTTVAVSAAGDVTAAQGDAVTCTVRNATASLVILERIEGTTTITASQFSLTSTPNGGTGLQPTTVTGSEGVSGANTIQVRPGQAYTLDSTATVAHLGLRFERYTGTVAADGSVNQSDASLWVAADPGSVAVAAGTTAIYRFVATTPTPFALPYTGGIGADHVLIVGGSLTALAILTGLGLLLPRRRRAA